MNFVNLKSTSEFSITQSINTVSSIVKKAAKDGMGAIGLTDNNGLFGSLSFYKEARKNGLKPVIGLDVTIEQEDGNHYQLTLLAKNNSGYRKLIELNSKSYTENRTHNKVSAKEEWLADLEDVIVLSGGKQGLIGKYILDGNLEDAKLVAQQMKDFFGDNFYIELQRDGTPEEAQYMDGAVQICSDLQIAPVATHPTYFLDSEDFLAHEARYCIGSKQALFDIKRDRPFNKDMYFKTQAEMSELFSDIPEALENTVSIAKKCNIELTLDQPKLPIFPTPNGEPIDEYFTNVAIQGLEERLAEDFEDEAQRNLERPKYQERLQFELDIIKKMGFPGYFLIVSDFITWAKSQDIPVGPGRGSGAGSLVAYAMKITDLNPLPYNLLFERFLNPDRVSMPDFDIDFCQTRRGEVYEYVRQKYGEDAVCQIGTFGTMAAKAVVRDVGRTLSFPYDFVDTLAKMINIAPNKPMTLKQFLFGDEEKGISADEKLLDRYNNEADVKKLIDIALKIEGITRQVGTHAAGVVISPTVLTDFTPLYTADKDASPSTQFEMKDVDACGLVKFDFLGLRNLTIIKEAVDLVNERKQQKGEQEFDLRKIPLSDSHVYKNVYANGNTIGIFQFEGKGMTAVLQKAQPTRLEDLIAINALYRPGPMDIIPEWLAAKNMPEEQRPYPDIRLKEVLGETYGFMIYQEQVMQCAQIIAGYSLGGADLLRRAMGKKKPEEMAQQRNIFIEGAGKNGVSPEKANHLFDLIEKFSGYGFNKSHAAAYSYLSFQTGYLKHYYPEEFFTATLNSHVDVVDTDKIAILLDDARKNGLHTSPPDINKSFYKFSIEDDKHIRYGLGALKGVGEKAILSIVKEREKNGPFTDFYNFLERVDSVNKRVMESLVRAGAFDSLHPNRAQLFEAIAEGLDYTRKFRKREMENVSVLGDSLFDDEPVVAKPKRKKKVVELVKPALPDIEPWDELTQLKNEKTALGHFFTSNPYVSYYAKQLDGFQAAIKLAELGPYYMEGNYEAFVGGLIEDIKWWKSKKGAFVSLSDGTSTIEVRMFADFLNDNKEWLKKDAFVSLKVKMQLQMAESEEYTDNENDVSLMFSVQQGFNFDQTKKMITNKIFVGSDNQPELIEKFEALCNEFPGSVEDKDAVAILCLPDANGRKSVKHKQIYVKADPKLYEELVKTFGENWVKPSFKKDVDNIAFPELDKKKKNNYNNKKRNAFSS